MMTSVSALSDDLCGHSNCCLNIRQRRANFDGASQVDCLVGVNVPCKWPSDRACRVSGPAIDTGIIPKMNHALRNLCVGGTSVATGVAEGEMLGAVLSVDGSWDAVVDHRLGTDNATKFSV